jgi:pimeloyl-ACP methyl ester carboxylesterase
MHVLKPYKVLTEVIQLSEALSLEVISRYPSMGERRTPLLFIHGAFTAAWVWSEHFLDWFAERGWPVHAISLRGHGGSEGHELLGQWGVDHYVADVMQIIHEIGEPPVLIGHSMGGFVAQKCLEKSTFPAAVLMCSVPPKGLLASSLSMIWSRPDLLGNLSQLMTGGPVDIDSLKDALFAQPASITDLQRYLMLSQVESQRAIWDMTMFNLIYPERLKPVPKLVIGAEMDHIIPANQVRDTAEIYGVEPVIFPGMGHGLMLERDWSHVAGVIHDWLKAVVKDAPQVS